MKCKRKLGATDVNYKIICAGSSFDIGLDQFVRVEYNGRMYQAKMHSKTKGRIDGLTQLYNDFPFYEGQELQLSYDKRTNTVTIETGMNCTRKLGATDVNYKIICAGSGFDIGFNKDVLVEYKRRVYRAKMHSKTKGRIDGLAQLYADFNFYEGQVLNLSYDAKQNMIKIS